VGLATLPGTQVLALEGMLIVKEVLRPYDRL